MAEDKLLVDGELFLSRIEEQNVFRQALREALSREPTHQSSPIFLVIGGIGMGKSKLLRRLRDIAARESPFEATCQTMLVDLDIERVGSTVFRERRAVEQDLDVFAILYRAARDAGWGHQFSEYQSILRQLTRAEKKFLEALEGESWGARFDLIHRLRPDELLSIYRRADLPGGKTGSEDGQPISNVPQPASPEEARSWKQVDQWFASRMKFEEHEKEIFRQPNLSNTEALASGFAKVSSGKPLVILLDSYENFGDGDRWLRTVIKASGPRMLWVVASSKNVAEEGLIDGVPGYSQDFGQSVRTFYLSELREESVTSYLASRAPDRLVTGEGVEQIYSLTRGYPLAMQLCGDLWASGVPVNDIIEGAPKGMEDRLELIDFLSHQFLDLCVDARDRVPLVFLAIQPRTDLAVLGAVVQPGKGAYELRERMNNLANRYFAVRFYGGIRFHPIVKDSLFRYLLRSRIRLSDEVKEVAGIAARIHEANRTQLETSFGRLEDRFGSNEWRDSVLDSLYWTFLENEFNAWRQLTPDFIDSLGYDIQLARSLAEVADLLDPVLSKTGRQRLRIFKSWLEIEQKGDAATWSPTTGSLDAEISMLAELERWLVRYGSRDLHASERRGILDLRRAEALARHGQFEEALALYLKVEKNLPPRGELLARQLALDFEALGERLAWRGGGYRQYAALPSPGAETSLKKALTMGVRNARVYHTLGLVQASIGKFEAALENMLQTVTMSPDNELAWNDLGDVYRRQDLFEKAVPAYRRATEINPNFVYARLGLAICYRHQRDVEEYKAELQALQALIKPDDYLLLACVEAVAQNEEAALKYLKLARKNDQVSLDQIKRNPSLDFIRAHPEFEQALAA